MERIDRDTWRTDNGDEVRAQGLRVTVEFGEKTKAEVLCAVEAVRAENAKLREYLTMACEVIDAAVAGGYNAADSSIKKMHATLKDLGIEVEE